MSTNQKNSGVRFWVWIVFAFILGAVVGFVAGAGTVIVLSAVLTATTAYAQ
jgi:Na+/H+-dicarboxylate symporter